MQVERIWAVYWSATGNTRKVVSTIAETAAAALNAASGEVDFTLPASREQEYSFTEKDLVILGLPTYAGRLPNKILPFVQKGLHGNGALAVPVVTYGNRSFDNALAELCAEAEAAGLHTLAAAAFVGRHAFSDELGFGRPNLENARRFGQAAADKVKTLTEIPAPVQVPGDPGASYYVPKGVDGQPVKFLKAKPQTDLSKCSNCGVCARACPMGAIDPRDVASVPGTCIKCQACVRRCTKRAKYFDDPAFLSHVAMLERDFGGEAKADEVFL